MKNLELFIGGERRPAEGNRSFKKLDPFTEAHLCDVPDASVADARAAVDAAAAAFPAWSALPPSGRRAVLAKASELLAARAKELSGMVATEIGSPKPWGDFNCMLAANMISEAAAVAYATTGETIPSDVPGCVSVAVRQPVGVVLAIAPWNAPVILAVRSIAVPLVCGNTVVLKASETAPQAQYLLGEIFEQAGLPPGVLNIVSTGRENAAAVTEALIAHPATRRVNFTGSSHVGRAIAEAAGRHLKPVLLELGGKAPFVVLDDADLEEAANAASFGSFMNQGQICMSTDRIVVDRAVSKAFVEKLADRARKLRAGDPKAPDTQIGALISKDAVRRMGELVEDAVANGATVVAGGGSDGAVFKPTVVSGVTPKMRIYQEEIFGPLVAVVEVSGEAEAISVANDTRYGLSAAVFGRDAGRAFRVAQQLDTGMCHINSATVHDEPQVPFGGVKDSGWGRFGGRAGIEEFTELRWITIQTQPRHYPI